MRRPRAVVAARMPQLDYIWFFGFLIIKSGGLLLGATFFVGVVSVPQQTAVSRSLAAVLLLYCLWTITLIVAVSALALFNLDLQVVVRAGGLLWLALNIAFYVFIELSPDGRASRIGKLRIGCVILISMFAAWAVARGEFIADRRIVEGALHARSGDSYLLLNGWVGILVVGALALLALRRMRAPPGAQRDQLSRLMYATLAAVAVGMLFAIALPLLGIQRYFYLGTAPPLLVLMTLLHAGLYENAFQIAAFALGRVLNRLFGAGLLLFWMLLGLALLFEFRLAQASPPIFLWAACWSATAYLLHTFLAPRITRWLVRDLPPTETVLNDLLRTSGRPANDERVVYDRITQLLTERLALDKSVLVVQGGDGRFLVCAAGAGAPVILNSIRNPLGKIRPRRNAPGTAVVRFLDRIIDLQAMRNAYFPASGRPGGRYRRFARFANRVLQELRHEGYQLTLPLVFQQKVNGFIALGRRRDGRPFIAADYGALNATRLTLAIVVEHIQRYSEVSQLKDRAERDAERMANLLSSPLVQRLELQSQTLIYRSPAMAAIFAQIKSLAPGPQPVLVSGETGVGKELIAQLIHSESRAGRPFVAVNCGAIPEQLWEDEIFGHVRGAYTNAASARAGKIAEAGAGVLFLDEIGEMPMAMQVKLLRVLQERSYTPLGGQGSRPAECRFVFATNRDLEASVKAGVFREDLYYRVSVLQLRIPPLRDRPEDIQPIVEYLLHKFSHEFKRPQATVSAAALRALLRHGWPGNIRELESVILRAFLACAGDTIFPADLPLPEHSRLRAAERGGGPRPVQFEDSAETTIDGNLDEILANYERQVLVAALRRSNGNKTHAADILGISRGTLRYKLKTLGISD